MLDEVEWKVKDSKDIPSKYKVRLSPTVVKSGNVMFLSQPVTADRRKKLVTRSHLKPGSTRSVGILSHFLHVGLS
jgi:hypothetical protein